MSTVTFRPQRCSWCEVVHTVEVPEAAHRRWLVYELPWHKAWPGVDEVTLTTLMSGSCAEAQQIAKDLLGR